MHGSLYYVDLDEQWRSQLIDCPGTVYITEIFPLYLKCCCFYQDHSILFAQEVCPGNQLAGYATVDECNLGTHLCNQNCSNTFGSYQCSCYEVQYHLATTLKLYKYSVVRVTVSAATEIRCTAYMQFIDTC